MNHTDNNAKTIKGTPLSSEEKSQLRSRHPLYTRLSGDVAWTLFEELEYSPEQCDKAMDSLISTMYSTLDVMDSLEKRKNGEKYLGFKETGPACVTCSAFIHRAVSLDTPNWRQLLPPFSIGCTLHATALTEAEFQAKGNLELLIPSVSLLPFTLLCPLLESE